MGTLVLDDSLMRMIEEKAKERHLTTAQVAGEILAKYFEQEQPLSDSDEYWRWVRDKVQESLDDPRPCIPHDQVMAQMDEQIARLAGAAKNKR